MLMDSYFQKAAVRMCCLESYYFDMKKKITHGLLLYCFLATVNNDLGSYSVRNIAKTFIEMPYVSNKANHVPEIPILKTF